MNVKQHVVPDGAGNWAVRAEGSLKRTFKGISKKQAERIAKNIAVNQQSAVVIHNEQGQIEKTVNWKEL